MFSKMGVEFGVCRLSIDRKHSVGKRMKRGCATLASRAAAKRPPGAYLETAAVEGVLDAMYCLAIFASTITAAVERKLSAT